MVDRLTSRFDFRYRTNDILPLRLFRGLTLTRLYRNECAAPINYENQTLLIPPKRFENKSL